MKRKATIPVRWQPYASELTAAAAAAVACGGEGSLHASLLGGGRGSGIVERNLLSQFKGDAKLQVTDDRPEPSLALSLRVGAEKQPQPQPQPQNHLRYAPTRHSPSLLPAGSSVPVPPQTYAPPAGAGLAPPPQLLRYAPTRHSPSLLPAGSSVPVPPQTYAPPAGAGLAPPPQLGSNSSLQLSLGVGATTPPGCGPCIYDSLAANLLKRVSEDLDRRLGLLRQELSAEVRKEVLRLLAAAAGVHLPAAAFSAAGLPQPCGGAWPRCLACGARPGTVGLKPYEHLCLCAQCSADASRVCLVCRFTWTGGAVDAAASRGRGRGRGREGSLPPLRWQP